MTDIEKATNPNASLEELFEVVEKYPSEVLANPCIPLLGVENPTRCASLLFYGRLTLAVREACKVQYLMASWHMIDGSGNFDGNRMGGSDGTGDEDSMDFVRLSAWGGNGGGDWAGNGESRDDVAGNGECHRIRNL